MKNKLDQKQVVELFNERFNNMSGDEIADIYNQLGNYNPAYNKGNRLEYHGEGKWTLVKT